MKLRHAKNGDIVTVVFGENCAIADARELKAAGFGQRDAVKGCLGEWTLTARSADEFEQIARLIPEEDVVFLEVPRFAPRRSMRATH